MSERKYPDCGRSWDSPKHGRLVCDRSENLLWKGSRARQHRAGTVRFVQSHSGRFRDYDPAIDSREATAARKPPRRTDDHYTEADYDTWMRNA